MESAKKSLTGLTNKPEGRVLVLYTGGTIGMMRNEQGGGYKYREIARNYNDFQERQIFLDRKSEVIVDFSVLYCISLIS